MANSPTRIVCQIGGKTVGTSYYLCSDGKIRFWHIGHQQYEKYSPADFKRMFRLEQL